MKPDQSHKPSVGKLFLGGLAAPFGALSLVKIVALAVIVLLIIMAQTNAWVVASAAAAVAGYWAGKTFEKLRHQQPQPRPQQPQARPVGAPQTQRRPVQGRTQASGALRPGEAQRQPTGKQIRGAVRR